MDTRRMRARELTRRSHSTATSHQGDRLLILDSRLFGSVMNPSPRTPPYENKRSRGTAFFNSLLAR